MISIRTVLVGACVGMSMAVFAQSDTLHILSMQEVYSHNGWLSGSNPIGLSFNKFDSFSIAEASYSYSNGNLENVSLPTSVNRYLVSGESFQTLGKIGLYGRLDYIQDHNRGQNWNGMTNNYWEAVNLCDSVSGGRQSEVYHLAGAVSLPLNLRWLIGAEVDYQVQMTTKDTDPRNKNEWSDLRFTPGIGYRAGNTVFGLSFTYANKKETVDYQNMGTHVSYPCFVEYPLSFFNTLPKEGNIKWYYNAQEIGGSLQMGIHKRNFRLFQELGGNIITQNVESNRIQDRAEGETNHWQINYLAKLQKLTSRVRHDWELMISYDKVNNYDPLQQQEETGLWKSYGKVLRSTRQSGLCGVNYEYHQLRDAWHSRFSVISGVYYQYEEDALLFYPIKYIQPLHHVTLHSTIMRNFVFYKGYLDYSIGGKYRIGSGTMLEERKLTSGQSTEEVKLWQNSERLKQNYNDKTALHWGVNVSVTYTHKAPFSWYVRLSGDYESSNICSIGENNKKIITCIGLVF